MSDRWGRDATGWRRELRRGAAAGTLLAGIVAVASGAASVARGWFAANGVAPAIAHEYGLAVGAIVPFLAFLGVVVSVAGDRRSVGVVFAGTTLSLVGIGVGLLTRLGVGDVAVTAPYLVGVGLGVLGTGRTVARSTRATDTATPTVSYTRSRTDDRAVPSDGGEEDDDLSFPLDDEE